MSTAAEVIVQAGRLAAAGRPFVLATVVDVRRPASTRRGDRALITPDGRLLGWVGGACSEPLVVREAMRALADGQSRLVCIGPAGAGLGSGRDPAASVVLAETHCASEGSVEVLVEPQLPKPLLAIVGESPAARTLAELARVIGWRVARELTGAPDAVVVATMGQLDTDVLAGALGTEARYVGLVASSRRAGVVQAQLRERGLSEEQLARIHSPAGLDLGPGGQEEIAVAILAEVLARLHHLRPSQAAEPLSEAVDPVCGMTIAVIASEHTAVHQGARYFFCSAGCRTRFESEPGRFAAQRRRLGI